MLEEIFKNIEQSIKGQMEEKFGLSKEQSNQSTSIISEEIRNTIMEAFSKGNFQELMSGITSSVENNPIIQKLNTTIVPQLVEKVGLSQEVAQKVKDFSLVTIFENIKNEFTNEQGGFDFSKVLGKLNLGSIPGAQNLLESFSKIFNK